MSKKWYEVWVDETIEPPYLLLVLLEGSNILILDPKESNKVVYRASNYEDAMYWLTEDEYTRVDGRMELE